jgi:hypothetical protein
MVGLIVAVFLVAHGVIHASYLSPAPPGSGATWPFAIRRSWLVGRVGIEPSALRPFVVMSVIVVVSAFVIAAASVAGVLSEAWFAPAAVAGAAASLVLLGAMFHPWIVLGFAIDAILLWMVVGQGWTPAQLG